MTDANELAPIGPEMAERNRELLAQRGGWPDGALEAVRDLEARFPDYFAYWTSRGFPDPVPGYGAGLRDRLNANSLHAPDPEKLAALIEADIAARKRAAYRPYAP